MGCAGTLWWRRAEEAAPPFPEAAPSTPLGSAPCTVPQWARAAHGPSVKLGHLLFPFPALPGWEPIHRSALGLGEAEGDNGERRKGCGLAFRAQPAAWGGAVVLPVWLAHGMGRQQDLGWRGSAVSPGAFRGLPARFFLVCPLSLPALSPHPSPGRGCQASAAVGPARSVQRSPSSAIGPHPRPS